MLAAHRKSSARQGRPHAIESSLDVANSFAAGAPTTQHHARRHADRDHVRCRPHRCSHCRHVAFGAGDVVALARDGDRQPPARRPVAGAVGGDHDRPAQRGLSQQRWQHLQRNRQLVERLDRVRRSRWQRSAVCRRTGVVRGRQVGARRIAGHQQCRPHQNALPARWQERRHQRDHACLRRHKTHAQRGDQHQRTQPPGPASHRKHGLHHSRHAVGDLTPRHPAPILRGLARVAQPVRALDC
jgi:hypothetical protein